MENKYQKSVRARIAGGVAAVGLATCCMAAPAFAAGVTDNTTTEAGLTGSTDVTVSTLADQTQLKFSVPTEYPFAADSAGVLTGPSNEASQIVNLSIFPIHVTNIAVAEQNGWNIVADAAAADTTNNAQFTLNNKTTATAAVDAKAGVDVSADANYDMSYAGSATDKVTVTTSDAKVAKVTKDLTAKESMAKITWTLAAGSHK